MIILKDIPILDSNVLISFAIKDKHFDTSKEILKGSGYINDYVICETLNWLERKVSSFDSFIFQEYIFEKESLQVIPITSNMIDKARGIRKNFLDNHLSFTDCLILSQAEQFGLKVYTNDIRMQNYKNVEVINPFGN